MTEYPEEASNIVNVLQETEQPLTIAEISEETHYSQSVVRGLVIQMEQDELLEERYTTTE